MKLSELTRAEHELLLDALHLKLDKIEEQLNACKRTDAEARSGVPPAPSHVIDAYERQRRTTRQLYEEVRRAGLSD